MSLVIFVGPVYLEVCIFVVIHAITGCEWAKELINRQGLLVQLGLPSFSHDLLDCVLVLRKLVRKGVAGTLTEPAGNLSVM